MYPLSFYFKHKRGIKHSIPCITICWVIRKVLRPELKTFRDAQQNLCMEICLTAVIAETRRPRAIYYPLFPLVLKHYVKICAAVPVFVATHVCL